MLQVGEYVVNGANGICRIEDTVKLDYAEDKNKQYFLLRPIKDTTSKVYIPVDSAQGRVRKMLTEQEINELLNEIKDIDSVWIANDRERENIYREAVRSCDPRMLVGIIKTLYLRCEKRIQEGKKNTAVDDRYFKIAEENLYSEIGFVLKISNEDVKDLIRERADEPGKRGGFGVS